VNGVVDGIGQVVGAKKARRRQKTHAEAGSENGQQSLRFVGRILSKAQ
jgi:hypothetical protein